jgi:hypothetical protein
MRELYRRRWKLHLSIGMARYQVVLLEFIFPCLLGKSAMLSRDQLRHVGGRERVNPEPANDSFGLKSVSFREGMARDLT